MATLLVIDALCKKLGVRGVAATRSSSLPLVGYINTGSIFDDDIEFQRAILDYVRSHHIGNVILIAYWTLGKPGKMSSEEVQRIRSGILGTVDAYKKLGVRVWFMKPVPTQPWDVPRYLADAVAHGIDPETVGLPLAEYHQAVDSDLSRMFGGVESPGCVVVLDPISCFVDRYQHCRVARNGRSLYRDEHHLSVAGAMELASLFEPVIKRSRNGRQAKARR